MTERQREQQRAACKRWRRRNLEKTRADARVRMMALDPEVKRARDSAHYERHRAKKIADAVAYQREHPEHRARHKARKKGASIVERFSHEEIAVRDEWACHICGGEVTRETWSIDHLIPLSLGGPHTRTNVKLAHHRCNASRGNRDLSYLEAA